jgi:hypothetical protein
VKIRESKFGPALVVECAESGGGYVLGFRIDPKEKLQSVHKELLSLQKVYGQVPLFGVQFKVGEQVNNINKNLRERSIAIWHVKFSLNMAHLANFKNRKLTRVQVDRSVLMVGQTEIIFLSHPSYNHLFSACYEVLIFCRDHSCTFSCITILHESSCDIL